MDRIELFGIPFSNATFGDVCTEVARRIEERNPGFIITPNVDHVCTYHRDPYFRKAYAEAFLILADGMPILWASWLLGKPLRRKLSGSDLVPLLSEFATQKGYSIFLFGAQEGVAEKAAGALKQRFPSARIVGWHSPPMAFEGDPKANAEAVQLLRESRADLCFVALGSPRQEIWMHRNQPDTGVPVMIGIGAGLDFLSGKVKRAPVWMQNMGMEWLWRLSREPRRLWHRYLVEDLLFFELFWQELRKKI